MTASAGVVPPHEDLPFGQFKLNPAIAAISVLGCAGSDRQEFAKSCRGQAYGLTPLSIRYLASRTEAEAEFQRLHGFTSKNSDTEVTAIKLGWTCQIAIVDRGTGS